jgi:predicted RNase H-like nuclease
MLAAGADGCRAGWICVIRELGSHEIASACFESARALFSQRLSPDLIAIDIPIGSTDGGTRGCDRAARRLLGPPRASSVFPAPIRAVLAARSWEEACAIRNCVEGRRMSKQAWGIVPKIREVDEELRARAPLRDRVREVHPEVSFQAWSGSAMRFRKKSLLGREERRGLVDRYFGPAAYEVVLDQLRVRDGLRVKDMGDDDILDAFAALWSAERILRGVSRALPERPPTDRFGLRMEIAY